MEGNEIVCFRCLEEIDEGEECCECDCCLKKIHKQCMTLSSSEMRVIPLQKRLLMFVCDSCKKLFTKLPYMIRMLETLKKDFEMFKINIETSKNSEIKDLRQTIKEITTKNLETPLVTTYASAMNGHNNKPVSNIPNLIIKPKKKQDSKKTKEELCNNIKPAQLKIGIKNTRETKNGNVVISCQTKQEIEKLKTEAERTLGREYDVHITKLRNPRIKIIGYRGDATEEEIEKDIREQNLFMTERDELKVTYIKKHKHNNYKTIFAECSPGLFHKVTNIKKVCIQWERYRVYEDISILRCFKCQEFYHKTSECNNKVVCEYCMGEHDIRECPKTTKKCKNCVTANLKFNTNHNSDHKTSCPECPSYGYLIEVLRSKIDYGQ